MNISSIIKKPIVTEKSTSTKDITNSYQFRVNNSASKGAIAKEIERLYGVVVISVKTMIMPGKKRRMIKTNRFRKTQKWKKAVVSIKQGQEIKHD